MWSLSGRDCLVVLVLESRPADRVHVCLVLDGTLGGFTNPKTLLGEAVTWERLRDRRRIA